MKEFFDKIITGLFIVVFGTLWIFTTKTCITSSEFLVLVLDTRGIKQANTGLRTIFKNQEVAYSVIKEYEKKYPELKFVLEYKAPQIKRNIIFKIKTCYR